MTVVFRVWRGAASLRYRNGAEITVLMCEQKLYLVWFSCQHKSYLVFCKLTRVRVLSLYVSTATQYQMSCHLHARHWVFLNVYGQLTVLLLS